MMLVDTSVWIDHFNGFDSPHAARLAQALADGESVRIVAPGIVLAEILSGLRADNQVQIIIDLFMGLDSVPGLDTADYIAAAGIFRTCRSKGETVRSLIDCLIAQICLRHNCRLLSKDRDFPKIARFFPLALELV
jgi:predicted nucleic acid-binding protein